MRLNGLSFYLCSFLSSAGSLSFTVGLMAFLLARGHSLAEAGTIVAVARLVPPLISFGFGHLVDAHSPRSLVTLTEVGSAVLTLGVSYTWARTWEGEVLFVGLVAFRAFFQALQRLSVAKASKVLAADLPIEAQSRHALLLTISANAAPLLSGLLAWISVRFLSFQVLIWFDLLTSLLNAVFIFRVLPKTPMQHPRLAALKFSFPNPFSKFSHYFRTCRSLVLPDLFLALSMCGLATLSAKLLPGHSEYIPLQMTLFGLAFVLVGTGEQNIGSRVPDSALWVVLVASLFLLQFNIGMPAGVFALVLLRDIAYAWLFCRISVRVQVAAPVEIVGSILSSRMVLTTSILGAGEFLSGSLARHLPTQWELSLRASIACLGLVSSAVQSNMNKRIAS